MQTAAKSPYEGKLCAIVVKAQMRVNGKLRPAGSETEARIKKWMREGVILEDDGFLPWGSVYSVSPLEPLDAPEAGTQPVELTKDEIWYLWSLASDDYAIDREEKIETLRASALKKLLPFVHPEVVKK